jgi:sulfotransferase family protein
MRSPMPVIVGVPRSGTTLLRMMLDSHPDIAIPPETGFLPALADLNPEQDASKSAAEIITTFHTWTDFGLDAEMFRERLERRAPITPADAARTFYEMYSARLGKTQWGDKTPTYGSTIDRIAALLPEARFIHIIRDGRDVMVSVRGLWFRPGDTVEACAEDWMNRLSRTRELGAAVPHYMEVRYESLVKHPARTLEEICRFLDLPFEPQMMTYYQRSALRLDEHQARYAANGELLISKADRVRNQQFVMKPPQEDRIDRWKTALTADDVRRFEAVAGDWLDRLGYRVCEREV